MNSVYASHSHGISMGAMGIPVSCTPLLKRRATWAHKATLFSYMPQPDTSRSRATTDTELVPFYYPA